MVTPLLQWSIRPKPAVSMPARAGLAGHQGVVASGSARVHACPRDGSFGSSVYDGLKLGTVQNMYAADEDTLAV